MALRTSPLRRRLALAAAVGLTLVTALTGPASARPAPAATRG